MNAPVTLYLADDHQLIIDGLSLLISNELGYKILGSANDGNTAYKELLIKKPDIALIDIRMPGKTGIELMNALKKQIDTLFVILSMHNDRRYIQDAMNYGASGYLLKNTGKTELLKCLNIVMNDGKYFPAKIGKDSMPTTLFTPRELEILKMIVNEQTTQDIAAQLYLSHYTVETHRKNICRKANTRTVIGLLKYIELNNIQL